MPPQVFRPPPWWPVAFLMVIHFASGGEALGQDSSPESAPPPGRTLLRWGAEGEWSGGPPSRDEPLASDRPDFTEASSTVGNGVSQLELGYTYFHNQTASGRLTAHSFPEVLVRQGVLTDWLELRIGWSYNTQREIVNRTSGDSHGGDDLYLGTKLGLTPQQGLLPEMALVTQMTVPLGGPFSANQILPGMNWLYGWDLGERHSVAGSTQYNVSVDEVTSRIHGEFAQSATLGTSLSERVGHYAEWFMLSPVGADTERTEHYGNTGCTYRWSNDLQFDVRVGMGLSPAATDFFSGAGAVIRF